MAEAGVPASIADRAAIVAALQVLCALPECARGALNARSTNPRLRFNYSGPPVRQSCVWAAWKKWCESRPGLGLGFNGNLFSLDITCVCGSLVA